MDELNPEEIKPLLARVNRELMDHEALRTAMAAERDKGPRDAKDWMEAPEK